MIRVLIVDDSLIMCKIIAKELSKLSDIEVIGYASNPYIARDKIVELQPDVVTLDIEMPRMDGLSFLAKLMKYFPLPIVIVSYLTSSQSEKALKAIELGAVEVVDKPANNSFTEAFSRKLILAIRTAALTQVDRSQTREDSGFIKSRPPKMLFTGKILAIGASTGGIRAIERILTDFPSDCPPTLIVQPLPTKFVTYVADKLNKVCAAQVCEAKDYDLVLPGKVLIAPGDLHMTLEKEYNQYYVRLKEGPPIHFHRPSIDVLFYSVARSAGNNAIGIILTGLGIDGAKGLLAMQQSGAVTLAEDEEDCEVVDMPKEAIKLNAANLVVPLAEMSEVLLTLTSLILPRECK